MLPRAVIQRQLTPADGSSTFARMAYASSLPYDAGHYTTCVNTEGAGYFTLAWHVDKEGVPVAELGLCLQPRVARRTWRG